MKKIYLLILLLFFSTLSFSQKIKNLDNQNGYKKLKFLTNISNIKNLKLNELINNSTLSEEIYYDYTGNDLQYFGNVKIEDIMLSFINNKLYSIQIGFGNPYDSFSIDEFNVIKNLLTVNYGNNYFNCGTNDEKLECIIWDGLNVRCEFLRLQYNNKEYSDFNNIYGYILLKYKPLVERK
jgi:hypothetical protein